MIERTWLRISDEESSLVVDKREVVDHLNLNLKILRKLKYT